MSLENLIDKDSGIPEFGLFSRPVNKINFEDYSYFSPMGRKVGQLSKKFAFKEFQFIGVLSEKLIIGCAIADIKYASNAFIYFFDPISKELEEFSFINPLSGKTVLSRRPNEGTSSFKNGRNSFEIKVLSPTERQLSVKLKRGEEVNLIIKKEETFNPLRVCTKTGANGWTYTEKANGLSVSGSVIWKGIETKIQGPEYTANLDISLGFMRRETYWNWASFSKKISSGEVIGLNLAAGVNETGYTENCFWLNDEIEYCDGAKFSFDKSNLNNEWKISTSDKKVDLTFVPEGKRAEKINLYFVASNFHQMIGRFYGKLKLKDNYIDVDGVLGWTEDHFAKW